MSSIIGIAIVAGFPLLVVWFVEAGWLDRIICGPPPDNTRRSDE